MKKGMCQTEKYIAPRRGGGGPILWRRTSRYSTTSHTYPWLGDSKWTDENPLNNSSLHAIGNADGCLGLCVELELELRQSPDSRAHNPDARC